MTMNTPLFALLIVFLNFAFDGRWISATPVYCESRNTGIHMFSIFGPLLSHRHLPTSYPRTSIGITLLPVQLFIPQVLQC